MNPEKHIYIPEPWDEEVYMPGPKPRRISDFGWTIIFIVSFAVTVPALLFWISV